MRPCWPTPTGKLRLHPELAAERAELAAQFDRGPDKTLVFLGEMDMGGHDMSSKPQAAPRRGHEPGRHA